VIWNQTYLLFGHGLAFSAALASLPVLTLLLLLGIFRRPAWLAGPIGFLVALLLAALAYHMPLRTALSAAAYGAAFGLFPILWIIFWAIILFHVTVEMGQFEIIKNSIGRLTADPRLQALMIAVAFGGFLEGAAGFGAPVAIAAAMMIGLGFSAYNASEICLLANTSPVAFGSIGIPVITLAGITGLPLSKLSAAVGEVCSPTTCIIPLYIVLAVGGLEAASGVWLPLLVAGGIFGGMQFIVSRTLGPQLTDILASLATLLAVLLLLRFKKVPEEDSPQSTQTMLRKFLGDNAAASTLADDIPTYSFWQILRAWMPYGFLVACVLLWGMPGVQPWLNVPTHAVQWPGLHDVVMRMPPIVSGPSRYHAVFALNWLSASGTSCMVATFLSLAFLQMSPLRFARVIISVVRQLVLPALTITSVLALAFLMNYCGATATLGLAFAATGVLFPFFSSMLGWLGVFLTGSDTSANALFGNLQVVTAQRLGFSPILMAAANSAGGVMGKMISLQTIAIAAAATGLTYAEQSKLFRSMIKHSLLLASITGCVVLLYAYILKIG